MQKKRVVDRDSQESRELLKSIIRFMKLNQSLSLHELVNVYSEVSPEEAIPLSIFSHDLSPSEALCSYLKQDRQLSFHEIAVLLNRDDRSIWTSCARAERKHSQRFSPSKEDILIPLSLFQDRSMSILENVVHYLRTKHSFQNAKIAGLLRKNHGSIATVANRAISKKREVSRGA